MSLSLVNFSVTDANGNVVFKVKPNKFSLRDRRSLPDAADNPILSFQKKGPVLALMHKKYTVHNVAIGKDTFDVTVNPNVVSLLPLLSSSTKSMKKKMLQRKSAQYFSLFTKRYYIDQFMCVLASYVCIHI
ncbi:LURP-one-related 15-like protein [Tanacetum coccineum]